MENISAAYSDSENRQVICRLCWFYTKSICYSFYFFATCPITSVRDGSQLCKFDKNSVLIGFIYYLLYNPYRNYIFCSQNCFPKFISKISNPIDNSNIPITYDIWDNCQHYCFYISVSRFNLKINSSFQRSRDCESIIVIYQFIILKSIKKLVCFGCFSS